MPTISTLTRLFRFALVGGAATLMYGVLSMFLVRVLDMGAMKAHLLAYALVIPFSFVGQKRITFGFKGEQGRAFFRFLIASLLALTLSTTAVWVVKDAGYPTLFGTVATMLIVPVISYLMMAFWVFLDKTEA